MTHQLLSTSGASAINGCFLGVDCGTQSMKLIAIEAGSENDAGYPRILYEVRSAHCACIVHVKVPVSYSSLATHRESSLSPCPCSPHFIMIPTYLIMVRTVDTNVPIGLRQQQLRHLPLLKLENTLNMTRTQALCTQLRR